MGIIHFHYRVLLVRTLHWQRYSDVCKLGMKNNCQIKRRNSEVKLGTKEKVKCKSLPFKKAVGVKPAPVECFSSTVL